MLTSPVAQIIALRTFQFSVLDAAFMAGWYAALPRDTFWQGAVPINAFFCAAALSAYFVGVFVQGALPQPVSLLGVPPRLYRLPEARGNAVALTFDDGPHPDTTPALLEILAAYEAKATFFLVGENVRRYPDLAAQIHRAGHSIGVHGLQHRTLLLQNAYQIRRDLADACALIEAATGAKIPRLLRPPYGFKSWATVRHVSRAGWHIVDWSIDVRDYATGDAGTPAHIAARFVRGLDASIVRNAKNTARKTNGGDIVLLHEQVPRENGNPRKQTTLAALPEILQTCQKRGLQCVAL